MEPGVTDTYKIPIHLQYHMNLLVDSVCILDLEVSQQLVIYKKCIREAAKRVRADCLFLDPQGAFSNKLILSSVSRALWYNDLSLASRLIRNAPIAADLIFIDRGLVTAHCQENFEAAFTDFFRVYHRTEVGRLRTELTSTSSLIVKKQIKSRLQCARRLQGVFWPTGRRLKLAGIKTADDNVVSSNTEVQA